MISWNFIYTYQYKVPLSLKNHGDISPFSFIINDYWENKISFTVYGRNTHTAYDKSNEKTPLHILLHGQDFFNLSNTLSPKNYCGIDENGFFFELPDANVLPQYRYDEHGMLISYDMKKSFFDNQLLTNLHMRLPLLQYHMKNPGGWNNLDFDDIPLQQASVSNDEILSRIQYTVDYFSNAQIAGIQSINWNEKTYSGVGDLDCELWLGTHIKEHFLRIDAILGCGLPTARDFSDIDYMYIPFGLNGHFEYRLGGQLVFEPTTWIRIIAYGSYGHVCSTCEERIVSLKNSSVFNFQPYKTFIENAWDYACFSSDICFFPCSNNSFIRCGYQYILKTEDHIKFDDDSIVNICNKISEISFDTYQINSSRDAHSLRLSGQLILSQNSSIEGGFDVVIGGHNILKTRDWHTSLHVIF